MEPFSSSREFIDAELAQGRVVVDLRDLQQARCPVHDVALAGPFAECPVANTEAGCEWQREKWRGMMNSNRQNTSEKLGNSYFIAKSPQSDPDQYWRLKYLNTQGIRAALRNLWRQLR